MRNAILLSVLACAACSSSSSGKSGTGGNGGHDAGAVGSVDGSTPHDASSSGGDDLSTATGSNDLAAPAGGDLSTPAGSADLAVVHDFAIGHDIAFASPPDLTAGSHNSCPCPSGSYCDLTTNTCTPGCVADSDCPSSDYCDTTQRTCTPGCRSDNDCAVPADVCQSHVCANQCSCDDGDACTADSCLRNVCQHATTNEGGACADDGSACTLDVCAAGVCTHPSGHDGAACSFAYDFCSAGTCSGGSCQTPQAGTCHFIELDALESPPQDFGAAVASEVDVWVGTEPTGPCHSLQFDACTAKVCSGSTPNDTWVSAGTVQLLGSLVSPMSFTPDPASALYTYYSDPKLPLFTPTSQMSFVASGSTMIPGFTIPLAAAPAAVTVSFSPVPATTQGVLYLNRNTTPETLTWSYSGFPLNASQVRLSLFAVSAASYTQIDCFASPSAGKLIVPMAAMQLLPTPQTQSSWSVSVETRATKTAGGYSVVARSAIYSSPSHNSLSY